MLPLVPFEFHPPAMDYEEAHLVYSNVGGARTVNWPLVGASLRLPHDKTGLSIEEIEAYNKGTFKSHGLSGYSIGQFHEFLIHVPIENDAAFMMGGTEVSFGCATPLAALVFEAHHWGKYFGEWEVIRSLRIIGVDLDEVEAAFVNACMAYESKFGVLPELYALDASFLFESDPDEMEDVPYLGTAPPIVTNIEPLRFFYNGLAQIDDTAACIYFYRVLEYFSFFTNSAQMRKLRHDDTLSDAEFARRVLDLVSRDEKGPIFKLVSSLVDVGLLSGAASQGLIGKNEVNILCETLYKFRNSIVHGKYGGEYALQSGTVIGEDPQILRWRGLLRTLAKRAIEQYGSKRLSM